MDILAELAVGLALVIAFWLRTGKLESKIAEIATALDTSKGPITGEAVLERLEAVEARVGGIRADVADLETISDTAKRGVQSLRSQISRDEEKLTNTVAETILPQVVEMLTHFQQSQQTAQPESPQGFLQQ